MSRVRVYELSHELGVESKVVLRHLRSLGEFPRSASSPLHEGMAQQVRDTLRPELVAQYLSELAEVAQELRAWERHDDAASDGARLDGLTVKQAARVAKVAPATIRQWVSRGHLVPSGKGPRDTNLFRYFDVVMAQEKRADATRRAPEKTAVPIRSSDLDALVTGPDGARIVGVSPSTIRMWVKRGHLTPARPGARPLYLVRDLLKVARR